MSEISRAAMIGTGTMGPGMGAVLERAGIQVAMYDVSEEAIERAKQGVELARGVLERLEVERVDGGDIRFETDHAAGSRAPSWCSRRCRRSSSSSSRCSPTSSATSPTTRS